MITARTLVRFVFAGLFVNAMAVACVVSDGDDNNDDDTACEPGSYKDCTCADGDASQKRCSASGNGYGACACSGAGDGGSGGGSAGEPSTTAGTTNTYGGETSTPSGGAGGEGGATMSQAGSGGEGGATVDPDAVCFEETADDCQLCVQGDCCEEWKACREDENDCEAEALFIFECLKTEIAGDVTAAELESCAVDAGKGGAWAQSVLPTTKAVVDCMAGGTGWVGRNDLTTSSCNNLCFVDLE
jgi:hypothetical protein